MIALYKWIIITLSVLSQVVLGIKTLVNSLEIQLMPQQSSSALGLANSYLKLDDSSDIQVVFPLSRDESAPTTGQLILFSPRDACSPLSSSDWYKNWVQSSGSNIIVLVEISDSCSMEQTLFNAASTPHVVGIVLVSSVNGPLSDDNNYLDLSLGIITIPAVLVSREMGLILIRLWESTVNSKGPLKGMVWLKASLHSSTVDKPTILEVVMATFIAVMCLGLAVSVICHFYYLRIRRYNNAQRRNSNGTPQFNLNNGPALVRSTEAGKRVLPFHWLSLYLPEKIFSPSKPQTENSPSKKDGEAPPTIVPFVTVQMEDKTENEDSSAACCAICLDDFGANDHYRELPCGHQFHCQCLDPWLTQNSVLCPLCKSNVKAAIKAKQLQEANAKNTERATNTNEQPGSRNTIYERIKTILFRHH